MHSKLKADIMRSFCSLLIIMSVLPGTIGKDSVSQHPPEIMAQEGQTIKFSCNFSTPYSSGLNFFWYAQRSGDAPRYLLKRFGKDGKHRSPGLPLRFSADLDMDKKTFPMTVSGTHFSDSAVYLCALDDTGDNRLTFGPGTKLIVIPKRDQPLKPSVYVFRSPPQNASDPEGSAACLATDYVPNEYNLTMTIGSVIRKRTKADALVSIPDKSYSLLSFLTAPWSQVKDVVTCVATLDKENYTADGEGQASCIPVEEGDEGGEQMRGLSLTVFGLRILFFKSVIFNALMSVRVWIS